MSILVSAVITTYKRDADMVVRAVRSVINQSYTNIEIIVVDDSPADWTDYIYVKEALGNLNDCRIKYYKNPSNVGACVSRNIGVGHSNGEYVAFLDDDDEWQADKIEKQLQLVDKYDLVYCLATTIYPDGSKERFSNKYANGDLYDALLFCNIVGSTSLTMVSRRAFDDVQGFDPEMQSSQDYDLWLRISKKFKIGCVNEELVIYHVHSGERITSNPDKKIQGFSRIIEKNSSEYNNNPKALSKQLHNMVRFYIQKGDKRKAKEITFKSIKLYPLLLNEHLHSLYWLLKG